MELRPELLRQSWFLAGPTGSGKSATAVALAKRIDAEIISLDSMAIYRGMDIGTAKPSRDEMADVPHHLIDVADPHEEFSVAEFVRLASDAAESILLRRKRPLFVGGTGLYLRSILRGIFEGPEADWEFRREMEQKALANGPRWLHEQLAAVDQVTAERLHFNDMRRMIRALEVFHLTGRPLSDEHHNLPRPVDEQPQVVVWLEPPREWLRKRIDLRVDQMMAAGWLDETRALMNRQPPPSRTACQALGYRELMDHLNGRGSLVETVEQIKTATRQFAKRQHTWFRNLEECRPISINGKESSEELAKRILEM
ncbi:MAG: tRNA (adenosine(37)-N6)-dimethylallyltransferase MiaA [Planctomycetota bacterium]